MLKLNFFDLKRYEDLIKKDNTIMINMYDFLGSEKDKEYFKEEVDSKKRLDIRTILINVRYEKDFFKDYEIMEK